MRVNGLKTSFAEERGPQFFSGFGRNRDVTVSSRYSFTAGLTSKLISGLFSSKFAFSSSFSAYSLLYFEAHLSLIWNTTELGASVLKQYGWQYDDTTWYPAFAIAELLIRAQFAPRFRNDLLEIQLLRQMNLGNRHDFFQIEGSWQVPEAVFVDDRVQVAPDFFERAQLHVDRQVALLREHVFLRLMAPFGNTGNFEKSPSSR